jgi:hypothetical protein
MRRYFLHVLAAALVFPSAAFASDAVTKAQVLEAIRIFDANASGDFGSSKTEAEAADAVARASNTILKYAVESDDVLIDLGTDSVPWCDVKKGLSDIPHSGERGLLFAAYVCGSIKAQLRSGKADPNPYEGWVAMLHVYRAIRTREGVRIPEVEVLLSRQIAGSLEGYAAVALGRSTENLRKTYGEPGAVPPKVAPQQP